MATVDLDLHKRLPLSPAAFWILLVLKGGEKHGYAILREVSEQSANAVKLLPGTLYNLLKRMLDEGWIEELDKPSDSAQADERRRYYRLTGIGAEIVRLEAERLAGLVRAARRHGLLARREQV
jgi:DNA-binding PadR family transcriptional regulator